MRKTTCPKAEGQTSELLCIEQVGIYPAHCDPQVTAFMTKSKLRLTAATDYSGRNIRGLDYWGMILASWLTP